MSSTYAASDATLPQNPGLQDSAIDTGTSSLDRAEDREQGLGSDPGITNKATTAMHQGMDQATGEQTPSTRYGVSSSSYAASDATQMQNPGLADDTVDAGTDSLARAEAREQGVGYDPDVGSGSYGSLDADATQTSQPTGLGENLTSDSAPSGPQQQSGGEKGVAEQVSEAVEGVARYVTKNLK